MLINIDTGLPINHVPHNHQFVALRSRLTVAEFDAVVDHINDLIDAGGGEIATAGWLPGHDWTGGPLEAIYAKAALQNYDVAAQFFGQLVWYTIMNRPEKWGSGRYEKDGIDIGSRTYFRLKP